MYKDVSDFQTIPTCQDGLVCRPARTCSQQVGRVRLTKRHDNVQTGCTTAAEVGKEHRYGTTSGRRHLVRHLVADHRR